MACCQLCYYYVRCISSGHSIDGVGLSVRFGLVTWGGTLHRQLLSLLETHQPAGTEAAPPYGATPRTLSHAMITRLLYMQRRMHSAYLCFALRVLADLCVCAVLCSLVL